MAKKSVEIDPNTLDMAAERVADVLNLVHWSVLESGLPPQIGMAILDAAARSWAIQHALCLCDECVEGWDPLSEHLADHVVGTAYDA
jgi:ABC-type transporter Mla maintaining outer membrane lipid asymmetry ATPase subunit MlaF